MKNNIKKVPVKFQEDRLYFQHFMLVFVFASNQLIITTLRDGRVVRWCWVNFQCLGVLLIWIIVEQGPAALTVGAVGVVWTFFSRLSFLSSFSLPLGNGPVYTEILSQRAVKPKTTNQPTNTHHMFRFSHPFQFRPSVSA